MVEKFRYRLTNTKKLLIATNLINAICNREALSNESAEFITNWILTGPDEKVKAFYDVWDIVLKNYLPHTRPILFRSCCRKYDGRIASFTGRLETARRFSEGKGFLIICDTKESLRMAHMDKAEDYQNTFFSIGQLMELDAASETSKIHQSIYEKYKGEDEYIMRANPGYVEQLKWL